MLFLKGSIVILMITMQVHAMLKVEAIQGVLEQAQLLQKEGYQRIWWFTDLDGVLVFMPSFEKVEGAETNRIFDEIKQIVDQENQFIYLPVHFIDD